VSVTYRTRSFEFDMPSRSNRLSLQISASLFVVFGLGFFGLLVIGNSAMNLSDREALSREQRLAARNLEAAIQTIPEQQRSATVWDDAVNRTKELDIEWMDENLGVWMEEYFGHNENFVLNEENNAIYASAQGEVKALGFFSSRSDVVAPIARQLRQRLNKAATRADFSYETLAEIQAVRPVELDDQVAIVSVVPIVTDTGELEQKIGSEYLHVAIRYVDDVLAAEVAEPIELDDYRFDKNRPEGSLAGIALASAGGNPLAWLVWAPRTPGSDLFFELLPVFTAVASAGIILLLWVIRRLLKFSRMLEDSERQALLDIDALHKAKQEATAADRAKLNFMSVVSHELRTPLTVILGYARLGKNIDRMPASETLLRELKTNSRDDDIATKCASDVLNLATTGMEKIERSGEHLLFLVNQLLDYAKMETGRLELDTEVCDVQELLEPVIDQMRVLTDQKGLNLRSSIHRCNLIADVTRTRQILINLLGNAIKFTDKGTVSVFVEETSQRVNISVSDTGPGIEKGELKKIFEAFHQADSSQSRNAAGTGLGLSVARELAKLENGTIDVTSEVGAGSTFTLSLPKDNGSELEQAA